MDIERIKNALLSQEDKILDLATAATKTSYAHHKRDFEHSIDFLNNCSAKWDHFVKHYEKESIRVAPKGRILMILSANEPLILSIIPVVHALQAGNFVSLKPSSQNIEICNLLVNILKQDEYAAKNLELIQFEKERLSEITKSGKYDFVYWFGSLKVISSVMPVFAESFTEFSYECEGNDVMVVSQTAQLEKAVDYTLHSLTNHNGESCNSAKVVVIHKDVYDLYVKGLLVRLEKMNVGTALSSPDLSQEKIGKFTEYKKFHSDLGFNESELKTVFSFMSNGEDIPLVSEIEQIQPALLSSPFFGPHLFLSKYENLGKVIESVQASKYKLGFSFLGNPEEFNNYISKLRFARININSDPLDVSWNDPWGGVSPSGIGGSVNWYDKFTNKIFVKIS